MKPEIHYAEEDCPVAAPDGFPKDDELNFEIDLLDFSKAKVSEIFITFFQLKKRKKIENKV
jgi:hypothetical protein